MTIQVNQIDAKCGYCALFEALPNSSACAICTGQPELLPEVSETTESPEPSIPTTLPSVSPPPPTGPSPAPEASSGPESPGEMSPEDHLPPEVDPPGRDPTEHGAPTISTSGSRGTSGLGALLFLAQDLQERLRTAWTGLRAGAARIAGRVQCGTRYGLRALKYGVGKATQTVWNALRDGAVGLVGLIPRVTISREMVGLTFGAVVGIGTIVATVWIASNLVLSVVQTTRDIGEGVRSAASSTVERAASLREAVTSRTRTRERPTVSDSGEPSDGTVPREDATDRALDLPDESETTQTVLKDSDPSETESSLPPAIRGFRDGVRSVASSAGERAASLREAVTSRIQGWERPTISDPGEPTDETVARGDATDRALDLPDESETTQTESQDPDPTETETVLPPTPPTLDSDGGGTVDAEEEPITVDVDERDWSALLDQAHVEAGIFLDRGDYERAMRPFRALISEVEQEATLGPPPEVLDDLYSEIDRIIGSCELESLNNQRRGGPGLRCPEPPGRPE